MEKRGQVTIFIIVAVIIIALVVLFYLFFPKIKTVIGLGARDPEVFMQNCLEEDAREIIKKISLQGGSFETMHSFPYEGNKLQYLCYTSAYYVPCIVQQPLLKRHIEIEIRNAIAKKAEQCLADMKNNFESKGYDVSIKRGQLSVELLPKRVAFNMDSMATIKQSSSQVSKEFRVVINNNLYELSSIATSIIDWEATYGDAETTIYMTYYRDLKVEKLRQDDGTKVYILTDRNSKEKFQFASRSMVMPPGY